MKPVINRKARHTYQLLEDFEAGMVLHGSEVKSIKNNRMDISSAYVTVRNGEAYLLNASIPKYEYAAIEQNYDPLRERKLLLHKREIHSLTSKLKAPGLTLVPVKVYTKRNRIKLRFSLAKGKTEFDKRETIKRRDAKKKMDYYLKNSQR